MTPFIVRRNNDDEASEYNSTKHILQVSHSWNYQSHNWYISMILVGLIEKECSISLASLAVFLGLEINADLGTNL